MLGRVIRPLLALTLLVSATGSLEAQRRDKELRLDLAAFQSSDGTTSIDVGFPGSVAFAIYMNSNFAIEPTFQISNVSGDFVDGTLYALGVFAPYYFKGDAGRNGLFVSPGVLFAGGSGDFDPGDSQINYGVDLGLKKAWRDNVSWRFAATFRDGDSFADPVIGATIGIGVFWK